MIRLIRYIKRYAGLLVFAVCLLVCQAVVELNLPNMMSRIVDIGIQQNGIAEVAPHALPEESFNFMLHFMNEADQTNVQSAYTSYNDLSNSEKQSIDKTFPDAAANNAMVLTAKGDALAAVDSAFSRGGYAFTTAINTIAEQQGISVGSSNEVNAEYDMESISQLLPILMTASPDVVADAIETANTAPGIITETVAAVLNKSFYQSLGADMDKMQTNYIVRTGGIMVLLSLAVLACAVGVTFSFSRIGAGVARDLRRDIYTKVTSFNNSEMDKFSTASLITRTTNDVTQVQMLYTMGLRILFYAPIMGVGGIIMALQKSSQMSWIIGAAVVAIMVVIGILYLVVMPKFKRMQTLVDKLNLVSRENLSGTMVVRAFSNQKFQEDRFDKANKNLTQNTLFVNRSFALMMPIMTIIMSCISLVIVRVGADQIAASKLQVGDMMAFIQYAMQIVMSFLFIAIIFVMVPRASVSAARINEVLRSEDPIEDPVSPKTLGEHTTGEVQFNDVTFCYPGADEPVLHNITFTAKPGQTTAFIGSTGSGKSTLVNLIPRFYDVSEGSITINGTDIRDLTQHELRENIGYVPQQGLLFSGSINSNLRLGAPDASQQTVEKAAEVAQATEFINTLEEGFDSSISQGGTNVSGGQRQRLSIARALVKQSPIYIFDDSFSALDFATDARLREALVPYTKDSTVLIVAQRVSTIMNAEQIIVLDEGSIVGIGTHKELLANCEEYREIAESQLSKEELA